MPQNLLVFGGLQLIRAGIDPFLVNEPQYTSTLFPDQECEVTVKEKISNEQKLSLSQTILEGHLLVSCGYRSPNGVGIQTYRSFSYEASGFVPDTIEITLRKIDQEPEYFPSSVNPGTLISSSFLQQLGIISSFEEKTNKIEQLLSHSHPDAKTPPIIKFATQQDRTEAAKLFIPCIESFVQAEEQYNNFLVRHPEISDTFSQWLRPLIGGHLRYCLCAARQDLVGKAEDAQTQFQNFLVTYGGIEPETAGKAAKGIELFTRALFNNKNPSKNKSSQQGNLTPKEQKGSGLLPTEFSRQVRETMHDMETRSGIMIGSEQRKMLRQALQEKKFKELNPEAKTQHRDEFKRLKENLRKEWEENTGQKWPKSSLELNKKSGQMEPVNDQVHHIIPQKVGGPHEWWNVHPLEKAQHQGGVHGKEAPLRRIMKDLKK
ncbi:MAG: HNH endonuclease [Caedimonas sp.]|nr:HNH endonuclease [Caedimonas sp.]